MPVLDHAVHPSTKHGADFKYGCNTHKAVQTEYCTIVREYKDSGEYGLRLIRVPNTMSKACRYMDYKTDLGCRGCPRPKDHTYINQMKELK